MSLREKWNRLIHSQERGVLGKIEAPYWQGLRIATVGGLMAFIGGAIVALGAQNLGKVVVVAGIITGVLGLGYHFILMIKWFSRGKDE